MQREVIVARSPSSVTALCRERGEVPFAACFAARPQLLLEGSARGKAASPQLPDSSSPLAPLMVSSLAGRALLPQLLPLSLPLPAPPLHLPLSLLKPKEGNCKCVVSG